MRGEQELPETQRGDELPNADDTWYLRVTLDVAEQEAAGLCCRVKHSSLGEQDIVLHWAEEGLGPGLEMGEEGPQAQRGRLGKSGDDTLNFRDGALNDA